MIESSHNIKNKDYQELFKTMLDKSGKDIGSMDIYQKKKFFNAVDKAYKAKSEGRLRGYGENNTINEISLLRMLRPFAILYISKWMGGVLQNVSDWYDFKDKKLEKIVIDIAEELQKDTSFVKKVDSMTGPNGIDEELIDRVVKMPEVRAQLVKYQNDEDISPKELEKALKAVLLAAARDTSYSQNVSNSISKKF